MTKQVLIITSRAEKIVGWKERERYVREFCEAVNAQLENVHVRYSTYRDLAYSIRNGVTHIQDIDNGIDLDQVQFVHFKNWQYELDEAPVIAGYLKSKHIPFLNSEVGLRQATGKLAQMFLLSEHGIPVPDTFYVQKKKLGRYFDHNELPEGLQYPFVMKANDGSRGDDNHLVSSAKEVQDIITASGQEKEYILQNFISNDGDYRVLFIGLDNPPLIFHRKSQSGSHLNNTSKGGVSAFIEVDALPKEYLEYAKKAAKLLGREIGGVDIIIDKQTNKPYVLEVNGTPALATGYGVKEKTDQFVEFLKQFLNGDDGEHYV